MPDLTPREFARYLRRVARRLPRNMEKAERASLQDAERTARRRASGKLTYRDLRRLDHPYAKRHGSPQRDPSLINDHAGDPAAKNGGELNRQWRQEGPAWQGNALRSRLDNASKEAAILENEQKHAFARPLNARVEADIASRVQRRREKGLEDSFTP